MKTDTKKMLKSMGFDKEIENVENGNCSICGKPVNLDEFKDSISKKEYSISGICQSCQNEIFG